MDEFFADTVTSSSSGAAAPVGDGMAATSASGQQAQDPDDEGFLSEFELILPKFVAILKSIQDGGEDRDIVRLALTPSPPASSAAPLRLDCAVSVG
jgi:hypothetical protein